MSGLKTTETNLNVNEIINSLPENNIKKDSIVILGILNPQAYLLLLKFL